MNYADYDNFAIGADGLQKMRQKMLNRRVSSQEILLLGYFDYVTNSPELLIKKNGNLTFKQVADMLDEINHDTTVEKHDSNSIDFTPVQSTLPRIDWPDSDRYGLHHAFMMYAASLELIGLITNTCWVNDENIAHKADIMDMIQDVRMAMLQPTNSIEDIEFFAPKALSFLDKWVKRLGGYSRDGDAIIFKQLTNFSVLSTAVGGAFSGLLFADAFDAETKIGTGPSILATLMNFEKSENSLVRLMLALLKYRTDINEQFRLNVDMQQLPYQVSSEFYDKIDSSTHGTTLVFANMSERYSNLIAPFKRR